MKYRKIHPFKLVVRICLYFFSFSFIAKGQDSLYKSTVFTPVNSFTNDVEGPAVDKKGIVYAVNFKKEGTIGQITPLGESSVFLELPTGSVGNGIRFDSHGNMFIADYTKHNILKINLPDKKLTIFAHEEKMHQPNDLAIDSKDRLYATDPDFETNSGRIWSIDVNGKITLLDSLGAANGIEVSPDGKTLFVGADRQIWAYNLSSKGEVNNKKLLIEFPDFGTDKTRCDVAGNLYVARIGKGTVALVFPVGKIVREIVLIGKKPTNVAFGGPDGRMVYVTLMDMANLESFKVETPGREYKMNKKSKNQKKV